MPGWPGVGCGARLSTSWQQGLAPAPQAPQHPWHKGDPILLGDHSPRGLPLSLCCPCALQVSWAIPSPISMGSLSLCPDIGAGGVSGDTWASLRPRSQLPPSSSATPPWKGPGGGDLLPPWMWLQSPWPCTALTGLYSGSHSGMLRLLISEAIFFLCPGLVTPMAVRSWGREGGQ